MMHRTRPPGPPPEFAGVRREPEPGRPARNRRGRAIGMLLLLGTGLVGFAPTMAAAQVADLAARCQTLSNENARFCTRVAQAVAIGQPRFGLAVAGGNPVPGTASTLGLRLGRVPRVSVGARTTLVPVRLPDARTRVEGATVRTVAPGLNVDAALGLTAGFSPIPTVGGVGSLDVIASAGLLPLASGRGFLDSTPFTWAGGLRLGLLRESFTLPGVSITGMYRRVGDVTFGDPELADADGFLRLGVSNVSLRGAVSKHLVGLGATAGVGYDRYSSDVAFGITGDPGPDSRFTVPDFVQGRTSAFANVSWTAVILHVVGELGWQRGGDRVPGEPAAALGVHPGRGTLFGGVAVRLSI